MKTKNNARVIFHAHATTPPMGNRFEFWHVGSYCHADFFLSIGSGVWGSDPSKFCYLHRIGSSILQQHGRATLSFREKIVKIAPVDYEITWLQESF